ncbi:polysaccharide pyruvyl transferase family protein [Umezawaea tangerina]|uniref:Polysaccharide pyruvyl transferase n=1 Tax=Umezawaea tangerina TaxID=84725 RepID=A0A2T0TJQ4_9PSEU|nr:polysaccharide pyruvyl transferase family protein [Umezawaea tangerina]PRY45950.1 polysaccharide pyruvyl transferase [Umezawaea tangerina]
MSSRDTSRPVGTVAVWGTFDLDNFGDHLFPRVTEQEITRRLDGWRVRPFSPFGAEHPCRMDGGFIAEALGDWSPVRVEQLAESADLTLIGGGEIVHFQDELLAGAYHTTPQVLAGRAPSRFFVDGLGDYEKDHPVVWNAVGIPFVPDAEKAGMIKDAVSRREYTAVRDELSLERLRACGVEGDVALVPDLGFLLDRLVDPKVLDERLRYLKFMGWFPNDRPAMVVQANRSAVHQVAGIAKVLDWALDEGIVGDVVLMETGPCHGDDLFADALQQKLPTRTVHRLPGGQPPEDILAAIWGSAGVVAMSFHANIAAFVYGKPWVVLDLSDQSKLRALADTMGHPDQRGTDEDTLANAIRAAFGREPDPERLRGLQAKVDAHFDRIAELAMRSWQERGGDAAARIADLTRQNNLLRQANQQLRKRQIAERRVLVDRVEETRDELDQLSARWNAAVDEINNRYQHDSKELQALQNTKLIRWSQPLRSVYGRIRRSGS